MLLSLSAAIVNSVGRERQFHCLSKLPGANRMNPYLAVLLISLWSWNVDPLVAQSGSVSDGPELDVGTTSYRWTEGGPGSDARFVDGARIQTLITPEGIVAVYLDRIEKPASVWVFFRNTSVERVDLIPKSIEFFTMGKGKSETLAYWSPKDVVDDARKLSFLQGLALGMTAFSEAYSQSQGIQTSGNATIHGPGGTATVSYSERTTTPLQGPSQTGLLAAGMAVQKEKKAASRVQEVLLSNSIDPQAEISGLVYFDEPSSSAKTLTIKIPLKFGVAEIPIDLEAFDDRGFGKSAKKGSGKTWNY
jgi:hypothetical protein